MTCDNRIPKSDLKLYDLPALLDEVDATLTENGGEETEAITAILDAIEGTLEQKGEKILFAALNQLALSRIYDDLFSVFNSLAVSRSNKYYSLTSYLSRTLQALGRDHLETEHFSVHLEPSAFEDCEGEFDLIFDSIPQSIAQRQAEIEAPTDYSLQRLTEMAGYWRVTAAEVEVLVAEKKRITDLHANRAGMLDGIRELILEGLRALEKTRQETKYGTLRIQANAPSYSWVGDPFAMPAEYQKPPSAPSLDTRKIAAQFKDALPADLLQKLAAAKARGSEFTMKLPGTDAGEGTTASYLEFRVGAHVRLQ